MMKEEMKLKIKKIDALYIYNNHFNCFLVYFCLCFTCMHILHDMIGEPLNLINAYIIPLSFSILIGIGMSKWANKTVKELELDKAF